MEEEEASESSIKWARSTSSPTNAKHNQSARRFGSRTVRQ